MNGLLPPSSSDSFFPEPAVALRMIRPTSVDPVKAILSMSGCVTMSSPVRPSPVTTFRTPAGSPAAWASSASHNAVSGANSAGFKPTGLPAATAGATLHATTRRGSGGAEAAGEEGGEVAAVAREPLERWLVALGRGPVGHGLEDLGDRRGGSGHHHPTGAPRFWRSSQTMSGWK